MRKILPGLICLALLAFVFTGCSSGGDTGQNYWQGGTATTATPEVTSVTPTTITTGTQFTVNGANFGAERGVKDGGASYVNFEPVGGGTNVLTIVYLSWGDTQIIGTTPTLTPGQQYVIVVYRVTPDGTVSSSGTSTVANTVTADGPIVTALVPTETGVGRPVTITGTGFGAAQGASTVTINGVPVTQIVSWSDTQILAIVPWGAATGPVVATVDAVPSNNDQTLALLTQARFLAVCLRENEQVAIVDLSDMSVNYIPIGAGTYPKSVDISPDRQYLYVTDEENSDLYRISTSNWSLSGPFSYSASTGENGWDVKVHPASTKAYVTGHDDDYDVFVFDIATQTFTNTIAMANYPTSLALTPTGSLLFAVDMDTPEFVTIDTATETAIDNTAIPTSGSYAWYNTVTPDGQQVWASDGYDATDIHAWRTSDRTLLASFSVQGADSDSEPRGLAVTPDGSKLLVGFGESESLGIVDPVGFTQTGNIITSCVADGDYPKRVVADFDAVRAFYSSQEDDLVSVVDLATMTETTTINFAPGDGPHGMVCW